MSQANFGHLAQYDPKGATAEHFPQIRPRLRAPALDGDEGGRGQLIVPAIIMRTAGQSNRAYFKAMSNMNMKRGGQSRRVQGRVDISDIDRNRSQDRILFPKHVIVSWSGIYDSNNQEVEFSQENCAAFLNSLPDWMMDDMRNFAAIPANFLPEEEPDSEDVQATAGN